MPDTMMAAPVALPMQLRRAPILPATVNSEARSVDVVFTTGAAVRRRRWTGWDTSVPFDEILEVSDRAVDLTRLNAGAPALDSHSVWSSHSQVGVVERAWIEGKEGKATIRFPREGLDQAADRMFGLISDGIIRNVSVGYSIERVKVVEPAAKGEVEQRIVERWTPLEVSFVTVPADPRAQVRAADQASYPVEIVDTRMQKEASMPESTTIVAGDVPANHETRQAPVAAPANPEPTTARTPEPSPAPDSEAIATRAREAERDRVSTIYDLAGRLNLERSFAEDLVKRGVSVDESRRLILDQVAAKSDETRTFPHVSVPLGGRDERITRRDAVANALLHRYSPTLFPLEDAARQYRGMTLLELARESLGNAGVNTRGLSRDEVATRALHSTSDFPEILSAVTNKTLRQAYDAYPRTFALFCRQVLATDFKSMHRVQLGEAPQLLEVGESGEFKRGKRAVSAAIREAGTGLKAAWRLQITGAGLGARLARTIRSEQFPKATPSLNAAAVVWSNAPVIVGAHDTGPLIRSKNGFWLAIPTPAAGKSLRGGRITPGEWERRTGPRLRFIYRRRGPSLLVAEGRLNTKGRAVASRSKTGRGLVTAPIFLLVPQVKLPKRLDLARDAERAIDGVPGLIVANWVEGQLG